jgi:hypothetical protein
MVNVLERGILESETELQAERRNKAEAIAAMCIGGMVVARAMNDRTLADELREGCMAVALELGGWQTSQVPVAG